MTELDRTWAESQIEAMADGSLSAQARKRMLAAMQRDPDLDTRVEQARALRQALRRIKAPPPRGLFWRLWRIPSAKRHSRGMIWMPAGVLATMLVAVIGANIYFRTPEPALDDEARIAAVQDFAVAVAYLQKSAVVARNEINETVGSSVLNALMTSRGMMDQSGDESSEGERENVD